jgi:hypothetical protein
VLHRLDRKALHVTSDARRNQKFGIGLCGRDFPKGEHFGNAGLQNYRRTFIESALKAVTLRMNQE